MCQPIKPESTDDCTIIVLTFICAPNGPIRSASLVANYNALSVILVAKQSTVYDIVLW